MRRWLLGVVSALMAISVPVLTEKQIVIVVDDPAAPGGNQSRWLEGSRSSLARRFGAEPRREAMRALTTLQGIGRGSGRQDAESDELRMELVADVHRLHGCVFEVQPHPRDGVAGPAAHARGGVLVVGRLVGRQPASYSMTASVPGNCPIPCL